MKKQIKNILILIVVLSLIAGSFYQYDKNQKKQECSENMKKIDFAVDYYLRETNSRPSGPSGTMGIITEDSENWIFKEGFEDNKIPKCPTGYDYILNVGKTIKNTKIASYYECPEHGWHDGKDWIPEEIVEGAK